MLPPSRPGASAEPAFDLEGWAQGLEAAASSRETSGKKLLAWASKLPRYLILSSSQQLELVSQRPKDATASSAAYTVLSARVRDELCRRLTLLSGRRDKAALEQMHELAELVARIAGTAPEHLSSLQSLAESIFSVVDSFARADERSGSAQLRNLELELLKISDPRISKLFLDMTPMCMRRAIRWGSGIPEAPALWSAEPWREEVQRDKLLITCSSESAAVLSDDLHWPSPDQRSAFTMYLAIRRALLPVFDDKGKLIPERAAALSALHKATSDYAVAAPSDTYRQYLFNHIHRQFETMQQHLPQAAANMPIRDASSLRCLLDLLSDDTKLVLQRRIELSLSQLRMIGPRTLSRSLQLIELCSAEQRQELTDVAMRKARDAFCSRVGRKPLAASRFLRELDQLLGQHPELALQLEGLKIALVNELLKQCESFDGDRLVELLEKPKELQDLLTLLFSLDAQVALHPSLVSRSQELLYRFCTRLCMAKHPTVEPDLVFDIGDGLELPCHSVILCRLVDSQDPEQSDHRLVGAVAALDSVPSSPEQKKAFTEKLLSNLAELGVDMRAILLMLNHLYGLPPIQQLSPELSRSWDLASRYALDLAHPWEHPVSSFNRDGRRETFDVEVTLIADDPIEQIPGISLGAHRVVLDQFVDSHDWSSISYPAAEILLDFMYSGTCPAEDIPAAIGAAMTLGQQPLVRALQKFLRRKLASPGADEAYAIAALALHDEDLLAAALSSADLSASQLGSSGDRADISKRMQRALGLHKFYSERLKQLRDPTARNLGPVELEAALHQATSRRSHIKDFVNSTVAGLSRAELLLEPQAMRAQLELGGVAAAAALPEEILAAMADGRFGQGEHLSLGELSAINESLRILQQAKLPAGSGEDDKAPAETLAQIKQLQRWQMRDIILHRNEASAVEQLSTEQIEDFGILDLRGQQFNDREVERLLEFLTVNAAACDISGSNLSESDLVRLFDAGYPPAKLTMAPAEWICAPLCELARDEFLVNWQAFTQIGPATLRLAASASRDTQTALLHVLRSGQAPLSDEAIYYLEHSPAVTRVNSFFAELAINSADPRVAQVVFSKRLLPSAVSLLAELPTKQRDQLCASLRSIKLEGSRLLKGRSSRGGPSYVHRDFPLAALRKLLDASPNIEELDLSIAIHALADETSCTDVSQLLPQLAKLKQLRTLRVGVGDHARFFTELSSMAPRLQRVELSCPAPVGSLQLLLARGIQVIPYDSERPLTTLEGPAAAKLLLERCRQLLGDLDAPSKNTALPILAHFHLLGPFRSQDLLDLARQILPESAVPTATLIAEEAIETLAIDNEQALARYAGALRDGRIDPADLQRLAKALSPLDPSHAESALLHLAEPPIAADRVKHIEPHELKRLLLLLPALSALRAEGHYWAIHDLLIAIATHAERLNLGSEAARALGSLNLEGVELSPEKWQRLVNFLKDHPQIQTIKLSGSNIPGQELLRLLHVHGLDHLDASGVQGLPPVAEQLLSKKDVPVVPYERPLSALSCALLLQSSHPGAKQTLRQLLEDSELGEGVAELLLDSAEFCKTIGGLELRIQDPQSAAVAALLIKRSPKVHHLTLHFSAMSAEDRLLCQQSLLTALSKSAHLASLGISSQAGVSLALSMIEQPSCQLTELICEGPGLRFSDAEMEQLVLHGIFPSGRAEYPPQFDDIWLGLLLPSTERSEEAESLLAKLIGKLEGEPAQILRSAARLYACLGLNMEQLLAEQPELQGLEDKIESEALEYLLFGARSRDFVLERLRLVEEPLLYRFLERALSSDERRVRMRAAAALSSLLNERQRAIKLSPLMEEAVQEHVTEQMDLMLLLPRVSPDLLARVLERHIHSLGRLSCVSRTSRERLSAQLQSIAPKLATFDTQAAEREQLPQRFFEIQARLRQLGIISKEEVLRFG